MRNLYVQIKKRQLPFDSFVGGKITVFSRNVLLLVVCYSCCCFVALVYRYFDDFLAVDSSAGHYFGTQHCLC